MTSAIELNTVRTALHRLENDGYRLLQSSDGIQRFKRGTVEAHLEAADGTDQATFFLEKPGHQCSLYVVWGLGEDCIADFRADSTAELDRIDEIIYA